MKVPGTYEGLRGCRQLKTEGIKTLATTVFTMEQAILAGEAGCVSISPFVHELKMGFDPTYALSISFPTTVRHSHILETGAKNIKTGTKTTTRC